MIASKSPNTTPTDMAVEYIRLMTPLLPPGRLAVRIRGKPATTEDHISMKRVMAAASRARAHRSVGLVAVDVHFADSTPFARLNKAQHLIVSIDSLNENARLRRVWVCLCFGATFVLVTILHRRQMLRGRRVGDRIAVIGENVYA